MRYEDMHRQPAAQTLELARDYSFGLSCKYYGHEPKCGDFVTHLRRLAQERSLPGGEVALKARCQYWRRAGFGNGGQP